MKIDNNPYESWINRPLRTTDIVTTQTAQKMNAILDHDKNIMAGSQLPPAWHWLYGNPIFPQSKLGCDGHPRGGEFFPPIPLRHRLWTGSYIKFHTPICFGDIISRHTQIKQITPRFSRNKKEQSVSITLQHDLTSNSGGRISEIQSVLYQKSLPVLQKMKKCTPYRKSDFSKKIALDSSMLFRFSAVTFNSHRIHYDYQYATKIEGHRGLVAHGPLIALMLLDCLHENHPHSNLSSFEFIPQYPATLPLTLSLRGKREDDHYILWAEDKERLVCIAKAQLSKKSLFKNKK